jgi:uncharacterized membrane protein
MEALVGYLLLGGVLTSAGLMVAGLLWHWAASGRTQLESPIVGMDLFHFVAADLRQVAAGALRPQVLIHLGLAVLLLTPYARVAVSLVYFAVAERNYKYTIFTGFVFAVLTYSLFLR